MPDIKRLSVSALTLTWLLGAAAPPAHSIGFASPSEEISVSTRSTEQVPRSVLPENLNSPGVFAGVLAPSGLKKYDWQTDLVFFADSFSGLPALSVSGRSGGDGLLLLYSNSKLPDVRRKGAFLRSAGVPVKRVTANIYNGVSTAVYTSDLVDDFDTRTQIFELFYYRQFYGADYMRAGFLLGLPLVWNDHRISCTLDDNSRFSETGHAFGLGAAVGLNVSFSSPAVLNRGLAGSIFLIYDRIWFPGPDGRVAEHLQESLNAFRIGVSAGWRFGFY